MSQTISLSTNESGKRKPIPKPIPKKKLHPETDQTVKEVLVYIFKLFSYIIFIEGFNFK